MSPVVYGLLVTHCGYVLSSTKLWDNSFASPAVDFSSFVLSNVPIILPILTKFAPVSTITPYALTTSAPPITEYCCNVEPFVNVAFWLNVSVFTRSILEYLASLK